jgi:hypothetical protein
MNESSLKEISKHLSFILSHRSDSVGLSLGEGAGLVLTSCLRRGLIMGRRCRPPRFSRLSSITINIASRSQATGSGFEPARDIPPRSI